ncbi:2-methylcitrate dehydratase [Taphrina deformans PYCC 5710]|uniref:2-methylcitrate dehydratase n=1 Tax=Taphrina deformans (strain PYCC 5710 / ATCC 11124 / CBS 356.35 / IMI 108563 / JCM 9778 / NBRC 8474) TaxID=1097556 RepID=R4XA74_TAPDE|nr:2-methylcitrate dehydratase [Taphrina deformans PYCC 5710]|eukprot:CCG82417.1 2-methylcitrate dehydratase [Taphrina deformans PYCC 5710]
MATLETHNPPSNKTPEFDEVIQRIAKYVHNYEIKSDLAFSTARYCLIDTIGCGLEALHHKECTKMLGPLTEGTSVTKGAKVPGTKYELDPVEAARNFGTMIRWLDFNDTWLAAEWGHPSDNLGGILMVADWLARRGQKLTVKDILEGMIKAHEIQGVLALENSFNRVGLDHVLLVKVASTAVVSKMLGLNLQQTMDAVSQAFIDGQSLRTYRHTPNTMSRKSWAAGDATSRAVYLSLIVKKGEKGLPSALTAPIWGFYDVLFKGKPFQFQRDFGSYVMENVLFKISFPAEFHAQTAAEAGIILHNKLKDMGKSIEDVKSVRIRTQEAAVRIIDKKGPLHNYADRDHCIQYIAAIGMIHGRLVGEDYQDAVASDPRVDALREKMYCVEDKTYSAEYLDPEKRSIGNALLVELNDGTKLEEVAIDYPVGHKRRREEGIPLLEKKFLHHVKGHYSEGREKKIIETVLNAKMSEVESMPVDQFVDLWHKE